MSGAPDGEVKREADAVASPGFVVPPSIRRTRRALAARHLLALQGEGQLDEPARWDWDTLGDLPAWCLLGEDERRTLQSVAGLVFVGPGLCRVVDGGALRAIGEAVGIGVLEQVLDDATSHFDSNPADEPSGQVLEVLGTLDPCADGIGERLLGIGASVLHATLGERLEQVLPLEALRRSLGTPLGRLDRSTAERVLARAGSLLAAEDAVPDGATTSTREVAA